VLLRKKPPIASVPLQFTGGSMTPSGSPKVKVLTPSAGDAGEAAVLVPEVGEGIVAPRGESLAHLVEAECRRARLAVRVREDRDRLSRVRFEPARRRAIERERRRLLDRPRGQRRCLQLRRGRRLAAQRANRHSEIFETAGIARGIRGRGRRHHADTCARRPDRQLLAAEGIADDGELALKEVSHAQRAVGCGGQEDEHRLADAKLGRAFDPVMQPADAAAGLAQGRGGAESRARQHLVNGQRDVREDLSVSRVPLARDGGHPPAHDGHGTRRQVRIAHRDHGRGGGSPDHGNDERYDKRGDPRQCPEHVLHRQRASAVPGEASSRGLAIWRGSGT
jgi:hypothetical protein